MPSPSPDLYSTLIQVWALTWLHQFSKTLKLLICCFMAQICTIPHGTHVDVKEDNDMAKANKNL